MPPSQREPRHLYRALLGFALLLALVAIAGLALWMRLSTVQNVLAALDTAKPYLTVWRLGLLGAIATFWPELVTWAGRRYHIHPALVAQVISLRWRLAAFLLVFDILFIQNGLGRWLGH